MWASGSQVWTGHTGSFTAKAMNSRLNIDTAGIRSFAPSTAAGSSTMLNVPTEKYSASMPTNMNALPRKVNTRNFIAEYCFLPDPHIEMRKYIGSSSSSQKMKNSIRSRDTNTPMTAV